MHTALTTEQNLRRLEHRVNELRAWKNRATLPFELNFAWSGGTALLKEGDPWPAREVPVTLSAAVQVPGEWQGEALILDLSVGGEALLVVGGEARGGLNPYHSEVLIQAAPAVLELRIEAVPKGLFGTPNYAPVLERARLLLPDAEIRALVEDLTAAHDAAGQLCSVGRREIADLIVDALAEVFAVLPLPRGDGAAFRTRVWEEPRIRPEFTERWDEWNFGGEPAPFPDELRTALAEAKLDLAARLDDIRARYPAEGSLALTGHALVHPPVIAFDRVLQPDAARA